MFLIILGNLLLVRQEAMGLSGKMVFWAEGTDKHEGPGEGCLSMSRPLGQGVCTYVCVCVCVCARARVRMLALYTCAPVCDGLEHGVTVDCAKDPGAVAGF